MHPQLQPFNLQLFLEFCAIFFPEWPLIFSGQHDSPSNLAESLPVPSSRYGKIATGRGESKVSIRIIRLLKTEKFAVELYDLNGFFAILANFPQKSNQTPPKDWR